MMSARPSRLDTAGLQRPPIPAKPAPCWQSLELAVAGGALIIIALALQSRRVRP